MKYIILCLGTLLVGSAIGFFIGYGLGEKGVQTSNEEVFTKNDESWRRYTDTVYGFQLTYRTDPDGYRLEVTEGESDPTIQKTVVLMLKRDYEELLASTEPREGPPTINILVFQNEQKMFPRQWAEAHPQYSGITLALSDIGSNPVAGAQAIRYRSDGLYVTDTIVIANGEHIFLVTGSFMDEDSLIRRDFEPFVNSFTFVQPNGVE